MIIVFPFIIPILLCFIYVKPTEQSQLSMPNLTVSLMYNQVKVLNNASNYQSQSILIYRNELLNSNFKYSDQFLSCQNLNMFILNQTQTNQQYFWIIQNYTKALNVDIGVSYDTPGPSAQNFTCAISQTAACNLTIKTNCQSGYSFNMVIGSISTFDGIFITQFRYNIVCNPDLFQYYFQIDWGTVIIVLFSILLIFMSSKFQQAKSYSNLVFEINYIIIIIYIFLCLISFILVYYRVTHAETFLQYLYTCCSIIFGILATMVCFSQFAFATNARWLRIGYSRAKIKCRVMDGIGLVLGIGITAAWYFDNTNWIISDFIFVFIYISLIKIVKLSSLKMALIVFISTLVIQISFGKTVQVMNSTYTNSNFNAFNNPLFIMAPLIAHVPNRKCAWHFIFSMAYPGMFLAYLERFDKNRCSNVYGPIFMICYSFCSILWFIVNYFVPIALPYDLFTAPIAIVLLVLFANRRGELNAIWSGQFYDQQKTFFDTERQLSQKLKLQKMISYDHKMFEKLKFGQLSDYRSSQNSNFSQVIRQTNLQNLKNLKHSHSVGEAKQEKIKRSDYYRNMIVKSIITERSSNSQQHQTGQQINQQQL